MKIKVDMFINGDTPALKGSTSDAPVAAIIKKVAFVPKEDLGFDSDEDRYQVTVLMAGDEFGWTPNNTVLKSIIAKYGDESDNWIDKEIGIFLVEQNVMGKIKKVAYVAA